MGLLFLFKQSGDSTTQATPAEPITQHTHLFLP